jgi:hypothetical protein
MRFTGAKFRKKIRRRRFAFCIVTLFTFTLLTGAVFAFQPGPLEFNGMAIANIDLTPPSPTCPCLPPDFYLPLPQRIPATEVGIWPSTGLIPAGANSSNSTDTPGQNTHYYRITFDGFNIFIWIQAHAQSPAVWIQLGDCGTILFSRQHDRPNQPFTLDVTSPFGVTYRINVADMNGHTIITSGTISVVGTPPEWCGGTCDPCLCNPPMPMSSPNAFGGGLLLGGGTDGNAADCCDTIVTCDGDCDEIYCEVCDETTLNDPVDDEEQRNDEIDEEVTDTPYDTENDAANEDNEETDAA